MTISQDAETGDQYLKINGDLEQADIEALRVATIPAARDTIQLALETLAAIKPIGELAVKQATRIAYLAADLIDAGVSQIAIDDVCREYRINSASRFFPDHSEFYKAAVSRTSHYRNCHDLAITSPYSAGRAPTYHSSYKPPEAPTFQKFGGKWPVWPAHVRKDFYQFVVNSPEGVRSTIMGMYDLTEQDFTEYQERLQNDADNSGK